MFFLAANGGWTRSTALATCRKKGANPQMKTSRLSLPWAIFLVALFFFAAVSDLRIRIYDEGLILTGAFEVYNGLVPHRDFYANYGPANFYGPAMMFNLFGPSFLATRIYDALLRAAIITTTAFMLGRRCSFVTALSGTATVFLWLLGGDYLSPNIPVLLCALISTAILVDRPTAWDHRLSVILAGALVGIAALFRYEVGGFVALSHIAALWLTTGVGLPATERLRAWLGPVFVYGCGIALTFLPPALLLVVSGATKGFVHDIFQYPMHYYASMRRLPFPLRPSPVMAVYVPFIAAVLIASLLLKSGTGRQSEERATTDRSHFLIFFATLTCALLLKGLVRVSPDHMLMAIVAATIALYALFDGARARPLWVKAPIIFAIMLSLLPAAATAAINGLALLRFPDRTVLGRALSLGRAPRPLASDIPTAIASSNRATAAASLPGVSPAELAPEALCAAEFVHAHTAANEPIFVGTMRHDKLFVNMIELYYVSQRLAGTHWYHFDPGLQTRHDVQRRIIADLERNHVRWIVRDSSFDEVQEPNLSAVSSGVHLLDDYLSRHFRAVARFGRVEVWGRGSQAPAPTYWNQCLVRKQASGRLSGLAGRMFG